MTKQPNDTPKAPTCAPYSSPTLSVYGGVLEMTASGTQPPKENTGSGGVVKRP